MQRFVMLLMLAALGIGGWMFLNNLQLSDVRDVIASKGGARNPSSTSSGATATHHQPVQNLPPVNRRRPPAMGKETVRIASYNIQVFGRKKASQSHIMAHLAHIVRQFDIVAIQEIRTQDDYHMANFVQLINQGGHYHYDYVVGHRLGRTQSTEQYAYVYNASTIEIDRTSVYTLGDPDDLMHREPLVAMFRVRGVSPDEAFTFILVNVHTDPDETALELDALADVYRVVRRAAIDEDDVILLGDFNVDDQHLGRLGQIPNMYPIVAGPNITTNTRGTRLYDNIIMHQPSTVEFTGRWGVFNVIEEFNRTLDQALSISDHFPVWAEFSAYESGVPARVATRPGSFRPNSARTVSRHGN